MNVTYITALYNIYNTPKASDRLSRDVQDLLRQKLQLIVYVDDFYEDVLRSIPDKSGTVTIINLPIEEVFIYSLIIQHRDSLQLPFNRNNEKDTFEYMALMNSKIEFLSQAIPLVHTPYVAWIDAGISKMLFDKENSFDRLKNANVIGVNKILIPGCYTRNILSEDLCKSVWWVFLGTFFICKTVFVVEFSIL